MSLQNVITLMLLDLNGAGGGTRTPDLGFTKALLYQLSYAGTALPSARDRKLAFAGGFCKRADQWE